MTTIDIDETTRNAILAALDERAGRLEKAIRVSQKLDTEPDHAGLTEDAQRALVWNIAALHETNMARLLVSEVGGETLAEAVPWEPAKGYHEWQARR